MDASYISSTVVTGSVSRERLLQQVASLITYPATTSNGANAGTPRVSINVLSTPINECTHTGLIMLSAFPQLFLTGSAVIPHNSGPLCHDFFQHITKFHDLRFNAANCGLQFFMQNQQQRVARVPWPKKMPKF